MSDKYYMRTKIMFHPHVNIIHKERKKEAKKERNDYCYFLKFNEYVC